MRKILFIGPCGGHHIPSNGASVKNYYIVKTLNQHFNVKKIDTENWKINPLILLRLILMVLFYKKHPIIISANTFSSYKLLKLLNYTKPKNTIYWVIGGAFSRMLKEEQLEKQVFNIVSNFIVEGKCMQNDLNDLGFNNVIHLPNFKEIKYIPIKKMRQKATSVNFVFLSRIIKEKGCDIIFNAINLLLNEKSINPDLFSVDFYGNYSDEYKDEFLQNISNFKNVNYKGFLDLRIPQNYDVLSSYDVMLFPTYWKGEGFPGIIIDAYISGLPVIASDWSMNSEFIEDGVTGNIIKPQNDNDLAEQMLQYIQNSLVINEMSIQCQSKAKQYDVNYLLNETLFKELGL